MTSWKANDITYINEHVAYMCCTAASVLIVGYSLHVHVRVQKCKIIATLVQLYMYMYIQY